MDNVLRVQDHQKNEIQLAIWGLMLLASLLPEIFFNEILHLGFTGLFWFKCVLLLLILAASYIWDTLKAIRHFSLFLLLILILEYTRGMIGNHALWQSWFDKVQPAFVEYMLGDQMLRVAAALLVIATFIFLRFKLSQAYVTPGKINAEVQPIPFLGIKAGEIRWTRFGWLSALAIGSGTFLFLVLGGTAKIGDIPNLIPIFPYVLLFAVTNAFAEEVIFRSTLLAALRDLIDPRHAIMVAALFFGIAHYYGVPYGFVGVIMASFLGWLLGKSMLETQGLFWACFIHFVQDVLIFSFIALGFVTPGG